MKFYVSALVGVLIKVNKCKLLINILWISINCKICATETSLLYPYVFAGKKSVNRGILAIAVEHINLLEKMCAHVNKDYINSNWNPTTETYMTM